MTFEWKYEPPTEDEVGDNDYCVYLQDGVPETTFGRYLRKDWSKFTDPAWHPITQIERQEQQLRFVVKENNRSAGVATFGIWDNWNRDWFNRRYLYSRHTAQKLTDVLNESHCQTNNHR